MTASTCRTACRATGLAIGARDKLHPAANSTVQIPIRSNAAIFPNDVAARGFPQNLKWSTVWRNTAGRNRRISTAIPGRASHAHFGQMTQHVIKD